jgi:hypothetical protein
MADTWAGNANNQLVTFKAFLNGVSTGAYYGSYYPTSPPDTREIMTVGDLNTYGIYFYIHNGTMNLYDTFTGVSNSKCLTKLDFILQADFDTSSTNTTSCSANGLEYQVLYSSTFAVGAQLYTIRALTTAKTFSTSRWIFNYSYGGGSYQVNTSGVILTINFC